MINDTSPVQPKTRADLEQVPAYVPGKAVSSALGITSNEMVQPPLPSVVKAISQTTAGPTTSPNHYPDTDAVNPRIKLGEHLGLPMEQVVVGCGSSALCLQPVQAIRTDRDEVVFPWRSFEAYPIPVRVTGAAPVLVPLDAQGRDDPSVMAAVITDRIRLIFVCNPNNSTGATITHEIFTEFTVQVLGDVIVVLDEAYIELVDGATNAVTPLVHELLDTYLNLVGLHAFSKICGLAGLRVGYIFDPEKLVEAVDKAAIPFPANILAQIAALTSLDTQEELSTHTAEIRVQRVAVTKAINAATGRETVPPSSQANFIWIDEGRIADLSLPDNVSVAITTGLGGFLAQCNILVRCFAGEGVHVTITTEGETLRLPAALGIER